MTEGSQDARFLELFPNWLKSLGEDAAILAEVLKKDVPEESRRSVAGGLNYIFKSLDLIPDGIDDLGFMDDAFVLRVAAALAVSAHPESDEGRLQRLAEDAMVVQEFLGDDYPRLENYVQNLRKGAARGRTVDDIVGDGTVRDGFLREVQAWSEAFVPPSFTRDPKTLIKLRAFLSAKLP
ncbi:MAG: DUF1232 domain-containing protein [Myxococcales bacterium]|nr:DUF1232 domain-containing protein [Myxococcales bacterium]